jgi:NAD(P)-dependent dehydrogenase (short-subunit alcohol dehydrogenase family)
LGQGIGRGIALVFAREGAHVVVAELKEHRAQRTAEEITAAGGSALPLAVDVARRDQVESMIASTVARFGRVDVLVNNAQGMHAHKPLEEITDEDFDIFLISGLKGTFWAMQAAFPHMRDQGGGRMINSSRSTRSPARRGWPTTTRPRARSRRCRAPPRASGASTTSWSTASPPARP